MNGKYREWVAKNPLKVGFVVGSIIMVGWMLL